MMCMNHVFFEDLVASSVFERLCEETHHLINSFMSTPAETASAKGSIAFEGASLEVVSMEVPAAVLKSPRSPRPKLALARDVPNLKKHKQKKMLLVHQSLRKHLATHA